MFASSDPVTVSAVVIAVASTFSKLVTIGRIAGRLVEAGRDGEIDRGDRARGRQHQRVVAVAAVDAELVAVHETRYRCRHRR